MAAKRDSVAEIDYAKYDFRNPEDEKLRLGKGGKGLTKEVVEEISALKNEPKWMLDFRLRALETFLKKPMPDWGGNIGEIEFGEITYYMKPSAKENADDWNEVPAEIKDTFEKLGIPEAERKFLAGVGAQYESEMVYHSIRKDLEAKGVVFLSMDEGLKQYPELVKEHFGKVIPIEDNKFAALNSAVWSGGSFVFIPKNTEVDVPLQAYFRINAEKMGQFERTLIIADEGSRVTYVEGCTAPRYSSKSLHSAVVEIVAKKDSHVRYTTIQNWANNIYNLVTKRAFAYENATVCWVDGNLGSRLTMKYPSVYLLGENAKAEILSVAMASKGQHQDAGAKAVHLAKNTTSTITSKSISMRGGRASYRGLLKVARGATGVKSSVRCDALILDEESRSDTYPSIEIDEQDAVISHEASVGKIGEEQMFYLRSRGIPEDEAMTMIIMGFIRPFTRELPMEYAVELNRLIQLEMEGSVG